VRPREELSINKNGIHTPPAESLEYRRGVGGCQREPSRLAVEEDDGCFVGLLGRSKRACRARLPGDAWVGQSVGTRRAAVFLVVSWGLLGGGSPPFYP